MSEDIGSKNYLIIVAECEAYLKKYGDNYRGVGWTKSQEQTDTRYEVMLEVIRRAPGKHRAAISLLDFGCGASHLYEYMLRKGCNDVQYSGLDLSDQFVQLSSKKFPHIPYYRVDVLEDPDAVPMFDYIVMNGIFTQKCSLTFEEMFSYLRRLLPVLFGHAREGIAFNVMSKYVDWERDDLFHLPFDTLARFLTSDISRNFVIRHDYELYEFTTYVYH